MMTTKKKLNLSIGPSEAQEQMSLIERSQYHPILRERLHSIPNEHHCSPARGNKLNKMGRKKGVSDLFLAYPNGAYHGLYLEMKSSDGKLTEYQQNWINESRKLGYAACAAYNQHDAWDILMCYLNLSGRPQCPSCFTYNVWDNGLTHKGNRKYLCKNEACERVCFHLDPRKNIKLATAHVFERL